MPLVLEYPAMTTDRILYSPHTPLREVITEGTIYCEVESE